MPRSGPQKVYRYSDEFELTAVRLTQQRGMQMQSVAAVRETGPRAKYAELREEHDDPSDAPRVRHHSQIAFERHAA